jgi:DNA-binding protein Fis
MINFANNPRIALSGSTNHHATCTCIIQYQKASGVLKMVVQESEAITIKFILDKVKKNQSEAAKILVRNFL